MESVANCVIEFFLISANENIDIVQIYSNKCKIKKSPYNIFRNATIWMLKVYFLRRFRRLIALRLGFAVTHWFKVDDSEIKSAVSSLILLTFQNGGFTS